ncbi:hypothetical protein N2152v2_009792 [Parachlorella kessleri]
MRTYLLVALISSLLAVAQRGLFLPCPYYAAIGLIPAAKVPHPTPLEGVYRTNHLLDKAEKYWKGALRAETVAVSPNGAVFLPVEGGSILASSLEDPSQLSLLARTGGRAIGLVMHPDGYLVVCDAARGLLAVDLPSGIVRLLTNQVTEGNLTQAEAYIGFADDAVVGSDGRIYFSDASLLAPPRLSDGSFDVVEASKAELLAGRPSGRVLVYDPRDRSTRVVASGIYFANGVALSKDESFLVVAETFGCRLLRVFLEGLPGFPDGVSATPDGQSFWVAIVTTPTKAALRLVQARGTLSRALRWLCSRLPPQFQPQMQPYGLVVQVGADGTPLRSLHDPSGQTCRSITSATQIGNKLFLGNLGTSWVCAVDLGGLPA